MVWSWKTKQSKGKERNTTSALVTLYSFFFRFCIDKLPCFFVISCQELVGREGHTTAVLPSFGLGGRVGSSNSAFGFKSLVALSAAAAAVEAVQSTVVETEEEAKEYILNELPAEPVTLYQYAVCPFCNKLRAYLDYMDISYTIVEVNPLTKSEIKGMKKNKNGKLKVRRGEG